MPMNDTFQERVLELLTQYEASGVLAPGTGIAISIVERGTDPFLGTYGFRERDRSLPVTPHTLFEIGSLTKAFTAAALLVASEQGRIDLNHPINASQLLLTLSDGDVSRQFTIADVLSHRTGLPANDLLWYFGGIEAEDLVARVAHLELVPHAFRRTFIYNNLMYAVLGRLFSRLIGEEWEAYLSAQILRPLGLSSTTPRIPTDWQDIALPYAGTRRIPRIDTSHVVAAGGLKSNLDDMTRWMQYQLNGGTDGGKPPLSQAAVQLMMSSQIPVENTDSVIFQGLEWLTDATSYGFGWFVAKTRGMKAIFHPAFIDGFSAVMVMIPEAGIGCVVLTNVNLSRVPGRLVEDVMRDLLDRPGANPSVESAASDRDRRVAGDYRNSVYGAMSLRIIRDRLMLEYQGQPWPLTWTGERIAAAEVPAFGVRIPISVEFQPGQGQVDQLLIPLSLDPRVKPVVFARVAP